MQVGQAFRALLLGGSMLCALAGPARAEDRIFDVPAQPAQTGIPTFARQAGIQIMAPAAIIGNQRVAPVSGHLSVEEGLKRLLEGTNLVVASNDGRSITLSVRPPQTAQVPAAPSAPAARPAAPIAAPIPEIEEVLVTARRRQESQQDVPVQMTVMNTETLREQRVQTQLDLQGIVPSLSFQTVTVRDGAQFFLRGQGTTIGAGPGVVAYFAEVPLPAGTQSTQAQGGGPGLYFDLESLQVLNGPQGTLFGRNTTGGAVLFEPKRPTNEFGGYVQGEVGNYNNRRAEAVLNVPVVPDKVLLRVAGQYTWRDGFTRDVVFGTRYDNLHNWAGRVGLTIRPTETVENYLLLTNIFSRTDGAGNLALGVSSVPTANINLLYPGGQYAAVVAAQQARGVRRVALSADPFSLQKLWGVTDIARWEISDTLTLRNIASYARYKFLSRSDQDGSPLQALDIVTPNGNWNVDTDNFTEELQLQGQGLDRHLQWVVGGFLEYDRPAGPQLQISNQFGGSPLTNPNNTRQLNGFSEVRRSRAVYAQGTYDFGGIAEELDSLRLTGGVRYTHDYKVNQVSNSILNTGACINVPGAFAPNCTITVTSKTSEPTWTVGLDYKITPDVMVYGKYSRGYKTGGANPTSPDPTALTFGPEYVNDAEIGVKSTWTVGPLRGRLNLAAFRDDYRGVQRVVPVVFNGRTGSVTFNAAAAKVEGVEAQGTVVLAPGLDVSATFSHLAAYYTRYVSGGVNVSGAPFPFTPKNSYSITGRYTLPLPEAAGEVTASMTYAYQGRTSLAVTAYEPFSVVPSSGTLKARLDWRNLFGSPIDAGLFVTNLTNKTYRISGFSVFNLLGYSMGLYGEPRMYGLQLRYRFGDDR